MITDNNALWDELRAQIEDYNVKRFCYMRVKGTPSDFVPLIELSEALDEVLKTRQKIGIPEWADITILDISEIKQTIANDSC